ncbi:hypothetical protein BJV78DRAFT_1263093 [Lactifluus subvellereus]|nr:hypothetical protein BJV78DRAFT_1263093 [Lactifluus subvellereus]
MGRNAASEEIIHLQCDHHHESTSRAWFHTNHIDPCIGVMQIPTSKASEILCP